MEEALKWWEEMTQAGRDSFPIPISNEDILSYYINPADYCYDMIVC